MFSAITMAGTRAPLLMRSVMRCRLPVLAVLGAAYAVCAPPAHAEDILFPGGVRPIAALEDKVRLSRAGASYVAVGRLALRQPPVPIDALDEDKGVLSLDFIADHTIHGQAAGQALKLVAWLPVPGADSSATPAMLAASASLERAHSGRSIAVERYRAALAEARRPLLGAYGYLRDFIVVPIAAGALDTPYRIADVVARFERRYVLFVLRPHFNPEQALMPNELDLYDADDPAVRPVLAAKG